MIFLLILYFFIHLKQLILQFLFLLLVQVPELVAAVVLVELHLLHRFELVGLVRPDDSAYLLQLLGDALLPVALHAHAPLLALLLAETDPVYHVAGEREE